MRLFAIVQDNEGEDKAKILAIGRLAMGVKKSTVYDYYETLRDAGKLVEDGRQVWTQRTYEERVQANLMREAEAEKRLTATVSLDAFDLEQA